MEKVDILIIGQGPAGLCASIYTARAGLETLVVGLRPKIDGDYDIENYFGFPDGVTGAELMAKGRAQAERFGAKIRTERALNIHMLEDGSFSVKTESDEVGALGVILATGVSRVKPGIGNLDAYDGKGVSYCVSCDGFFYRGQKVLVLGEGVYAASQALELLTHTQDVAICTQGKDSAITPEFVQRLSEAGIEVIENKITELEGENGLERVVFEDGQKREAYGLFIAMGEASSTDFARSMGIELKGVYVVADDEQKTNLEGVFAAGDCVGRFLQISVAVGEGARAARSANLFVKKKKRLSSKDDSGS